MPERSCSRLIAPACCAAHCCRLWTLPTLTDTPSKSRVNSVTPRYELRQISVSPSIAWRSHLLLAAHAEPRGQIADRFRSRHRLNGQFLTFTLRQLRRRASESIHACTTTKKMGAHYRLWQRQ